MTIRYECPECSSALKIRVEKAGQRGKCPKCRASFTIPEVPEEGDLVDMPLEVTPLVIVAEESIGSGGESVGLNSDLAAAGVGLPVAADELKPSVAELMQEHQEKRARKKARQDRLESRTRNPLLADAATSGSAADAITRRYEKKREEASDAPILSRDQRRAVEERTAIMRFGVQLGAVLLVTTLFGYSLFNFVLADRSTNLVEVTGKVTLRGEPTMTGYTIRFTPVQERRGTKLEGGPSSAKVNNNGEFRLLYDALTVGAVIATHEVTFEDEFGVLQTIPDDYARCEVTADGDNRFEFNF